MNQKSGFALIEILVVLFISLTILGIAIFNYHSGRGKYNLDDAINELATNIRQTEHWSISGKTYQGNFPQGGYGIFFTKTNPSSYTIFADSSQDHNYQPSEEVEVISLPPHIEILSLSPSSPLNIVFQPPWPDIYVNSSTSTSATIILRDTTTGSTKSITVNPQGGISF